MLKIRYEFVDGTSCEVEVNKELFEIYEALIQKEKRNHWQQTWRRISLNYLAECGIDYEDRDSNPEVGLIKKEDDERLHKAISFLKPSQRKLIKKVFFDGMTEMQIAKECGISQSAISQQLKTIYKKILKLL